MSFNKIIEDWKNQNNDPLGYWLSKLDEDQVKLMEDLKIRFNYKIDYFRELKIEEIQTEIDRHISFNAKKIQLDKYHEKIINKDSYAFNAYYRTIIDRDNYNLINDEMYPEFIKVFGVIGLDSPWVFEEEELKAIEFLEDVTTLNIIEFMLEGLDENRDYITNRFEEIEEWKRLLKRFVANIDNKHPTSMFTIIFLWILNKKGVTPPTQKDYMTYVHKNFAHILKKKAFTKLNPGINTDSNKYIKYKKELNDLYDLNIN